MTVLPYVENVENNKHRVTAIKETLDKTNLRNWKIHGEINLERCMQLNGRLDGHMVQGHVDATAFCIDVEEKKEAGNTVSSFLQNSRIF
jgi:riboflavin synthase